jgi:PHD/YefM family antitoxin component YafN of YafNO toxin-antitoxin module
MLDMLKRYPLSEFQENADDFIVMLKESQQPIVLTIDGEDAVVVEDAEAYQKLLETVDIARSAVVIQQRHAQFLQDGIEFDAIEALDDLSDELGLPK